MTLLRYWALTRCGTRAENEDACIVPDYGLVDEDAVAHGQVALREDGAIVAIADGVGGGPDGRLAAVTALQALTADVVKNNDASLLEKQLRNADLAVQDLKSERGRPATTIAGLCAGIEATHVFNLGDTRVYDLSNERRVLTEDHRSAFNRSAITRFLGGGPAQAVSRIISFETRPSKLLVCSDGLYNFISNASLALLIDREPESELPRLFDTAEAYGSNDNLSAIYCEIE